MPLPKSIRLLRKAECALLSAIEIYNKPDFKYREECFAILMLNAWELLLKAKYLHEKGNDPRFLYVYDPMPTKSGRPSKRTVARRNRSGNYFTKSLSSLIGEFDRDRSSQLPSAVKVNIEALTEIRDNAVHYFNMGTDLVRQVYEVGSASILNFGELAKRWFAWDLSAYSLYLLPLGFISTPSKLPAMPSSADEARLIHYLARAIASPMDKNEDFHIALEVDIRLKRSAGTVTTVGLTNDPNAIGVTLSEEDIRQNWPWDYRELISRLQARYSDFKINKEFYIRRAPIMLDDKLVKTRFLDPSKPKSSKKDFYNPNVIAYFDKFYTKLITNGTR